MTPKKGWQDKFLKRLAETGNVTKACQYAKCSRQEAYRTRDEDAFFKAAWDEAKVVAKELLEFEARRRAEKGYLEPVFQQGAQVGTVRKYSDTLLIFLLKALDPDAYRDNSHVQHSGSVDINVVKGYVNVSPDTWDKNKNDG